MDYVLHQVDAKQPSAVQQALSAHFRNVFPAESDAFLSPLFAGIVAMFAGKYLDYGPVLTAYHDREHSFQAALCMARLLDGRVECGEAPALLARHYRIGLAGALLHDVGYMLDPGDSGGTGARYTLTHEERGCVIAQPFLEGLGWPQEDIDWLTAIIRCTGPRSKIRELPFAGDVHRFLGQALCTADYLGQMSDYQYLRKLPILFLEFQECDDFLGVPPEKRLFRSALELLEKTPGFWSFVQAQILGANCGGVFRYLARPWPDGPNPYLLGVEKNMAEIRRLQAQGLLSSLLNVE